ncbi:MAG TPA: nitrate reductase [Mycobacteriales bacterium]|nr:nitrate reductase [Mycobacteriales bacterium]
MVDRIADIWGERTPHAADTSWPVRVDQYLTVPEREVDEWVASCCVLCSNGCGKDIAVKDGRMVGARGRAKDRVSRGRLGPKGLFGWQANNAADRLTRPLVREGGNLVESDWETAMSRIVQRSKQVLDESGPLAMGFYTTGQLFAEEYFALMKLARIGLGTPHLDGNTRLCTATAEWALIESFGSDGDPGSYEDIDLCDTLFLVGHNVAETQTVLWARMLDRLRGPDRPRLVVVDPRPTMPAREADVHLAIRNGTNVMLLNALMHEMIRNDWVDHDWVSEHTIGYEGLADIVKEYPPERAAEVCGVEARDISAAAEILGTGERLVSTALQGVYQSNQATAAAVQINNINLLRGMIGQPGCTVFQMNGQPTAENTRETGANGSLPGYRNWQNDDHVQDLAKLFNVDILRVPHWADPTHAMQIFRYAEEGSIKFLWIQCTNPAVTLPELRRIRSILDQDRLFVVAQDAWLTETAALADVVLPAAIWGEKTGCMTNADRTVHLAQRAVDPPGEARADFDIFVDYARRMELEDDHGHPLLPWDDSEDAWREFAQVTAGRLCDQTGITYAKLRNSAGIQWPCNAEHPNGTPRLYADGRFATDPDFCESYGHDLTSGASNESDEYRAHDPAGRALLKGAHYVAPDEGPTTEFPFLLNTGRTAYHFHTRTKTKHAPQLDAAAPDVWVELNADDATKLGIQEGDVVKVSSPRAAIQAPARITGIRPGVVFLPFHYGYWDIDRKQPDGFGRAANELTITKWDPVSKQPIYKTGAVKVEKVTAGNRPAPAPTTTASRPTSDAVPATVGTDADATSRRRAPSRSTR